MRLLLFSFLTLLTLGLSQAQQTPARQPIYIAVLDSPLDYAHPDISAILDEGLLKNVSTVNEKGVLKSWYDLNLEAKAEFDRRMTQKEYDEQIRYFDALKGGNITNASAFNQFLFKMKCNLKYYYSKKFRSGLNIIGLYIHGTHVAGIAMKNLSEAKLIHFPFLTYSDSSKKATFFDVYATLLNLTNLREKQKQRYQQLSQVLKANHVKVVNLSLGTSEDMIFNAIKDDLSFFERAFKKEEIRQAAYRIASMHVEEMKNFIESNPQTIFVLAAGNENQNLSKATVASGQIQSKNLITVAANRTDGTMTSFSNYSPEFVDVAAPGAKILSSLVGGGEIQLSGTSMAAPKVANALGSIFENQPDLSASEAIDLFYTQYTAHQPELANLVANGRSLNEKSLLNNLAKKIDPPKENLVIRSCKSIFSGL